MLHHATSFAGLHERYCIYLYHHTNTYIPNLKRRITEPLASVTSDVLVKVSEEMEHQNDVCRAIRGAYTEFAGNFMILATQTL